MSTDIGAGLLLSLVENQMPQSKHKPSLLPMMMELFTMQHQDKRKKNNLHSLLPRQGIKFTSILPLSIIFFTVKQFSHFFYCYLQSSFKCNLMHYLSLKLNVNKLPQLPSHIHEVSSIIKHLTHHTYVQKDGWTYRQAMQVVKSPL